jgi:hypothetical protein
MFQTGSTADITPLPSFLYSRYNLGDYNYALLTYKSEKNSRCHNFFISVSESSILINFLVISGNETADIDLQSIHADLQTIYIHSKKKKNFLWSLCFPSLTIFCYYHGRIEQIKIVCNTLGFIDHFWYYIDILTEKIFA